MNVTLSEKTVSRCDQVANLKMRSSWITRMGPKCNDKCSFKKKRRLCEDGGRDWGDVTTRNTWSHQELAEAGWILPYGGSVTLPDTLILDFRPLEVGESKFLLS